MQSATPDGPPPNKRSVPLADLYRGTNNPGRTRTLRSAGGALGATEGKNNGHEEEEQACTAPAIGTRAGAPPSSRSQEQYKQVRRTGSSARAGGLTTSQYVRRRKDGPAAAVTTRRGEGGSEKSVQNMELGGNVVKSNVDAGGFLDVTAEVLRSEELKSSKRRMENTGHLSVSFDGPDPRAYAAGVRRASSIPGTSAASSIPATSSGGAGFDIKTSLDTFSFSSRSAAVKGTVSSRKHVVNQKLVRMCGRGGRAGGRRGQVGGPLLEDEEDNYSIFAGAPTGARKCSPDAAPRRSPNAARSYNSANPSPISVVVEEQEPPAARGEQEGCRWGESTFCDQNEFAERTCAEVEWSCSAGSSARSTALERAEQDHSTLENNLFCIGAPASAPATAFSSKQAPSGSSLTTAFSSKQGAPPGSSEFRRTFSSKRGAPPGSSPNRDVETRRAAATLTSSGTVSCVEIMPPELDLQLHDQEDEEPQDTIHDGLTTSAAPADGTTTLLLDAARLQHERAVLAEELRVNEQSLSRLAAKFSHLDDEIDYWKKVGTEKKRDNGALKLRLAALEVELERAREGQKSAEEELDRGRQVGGCCWGEVLSCIR